ncbi:putative late blight resistance protein homolog R1B-14 [Corylus avellana]|uniref:putative late blight resistance protein homolog R1B-14 n=1 Tax=Corylus avellana TaxID=13451 RepID=UPI00286C090B|nr:putative late blight resistance protein homolog R1B-14 [Corylus avellana]
MEDLLNAELFDNREKYGVEIAESSADTTTEALYERRRKVMEDDVVGFHDHSTRLVQQLTEGNLQLGVVSIGGTCGLGKTTLARKIYNNVGIKSHFNCRAWVCISQNFKIRNVLLEILKYEMPKSELTGKKLFKYSNDDELKKKLFKCLQGRRYLIVMDDIITELWDEVRSAFPDESNGSRILLIGCLKRTSLSHTFSLSFLGIDESWELFSKKVFRGGTCPPELESLGIKIAGHCCGLPLSIVVLGSLLATKEKTSQAWSELISNLNWDLKEVSSICEDILALTYTLLPWHLKPCFLYFAVYPKGFEIPVSQLVQMWIGEGFMQHTGRTDLEDVAEEYLEELIDLSLIQVASRRTNGGVKTCRIHALIQDLCILESVKVKFLEVSTNVNLLLANKSLRVCIQGSIDPYISSNSSYPSLSLLFLGQRTHRFDPNHWKWVLENCKFLQVLNFGCVDLYSIPTRIEELIHLRYLAVESDALKAIPDSIGKLINLETLDFRGTFLNCLPKGIWMLPHLRNLYMSGPVSLPDNLDPEVRVLSSLQTLSTVSLNPQSDCPIVEAKLPNLRKLGICFAADEINNKVVDVLNCLHHLDHLQILKIINCSECPSLPISFPLSITKITLRHVRVKVRRDMKVLGKLPNLQILKLQSCLLSCKLYVFAGSFPKLQVLKLENLRIKKWKQRRGAMPCLKHLVIKQCIELTELPSNLWSLTALRDVELLWSTSDLGKMLWEMQMKVGFNLLVYPPASTDDPVEKTVNESESRGTSFSDGIRNCRFSSGLELGSFVVTSNVLHHSWAAISELYGEIHEPPSWASPVRFRTFQQPNCTIIAFVTWPPCTKEHLQGQGGGDLVSSSALKETFPLFEFLSTKTNPRFSINKPAIDLFASVRGVLDFLKSQIGTCRMGATKEEVAVVEKVENCEAKRSLDCRVLEKSNNYRRITNVSHLYALFVFGEFHLYLRTILLSFGRICVVSNVLVKMLCFPFRFQFLGCKAGREGIRAGDGNRENQRQDGRTSNRNHQGRAPHFLSSIFCVLFSLASMKLAYCSLQA